MLTRFRCYFSFLVDRGVEMGELGESEKDIERIFQGRLVVNFV